MKCHEVQESFGDYFDLNEAHPVRKQVDEHIQFCTSCAEEFQLWAESTELIREVREVPTIVGEPALIASRVMSRIYENESWRIPVSDRIYAIPFQVRRKLTAVISFCLAIFVVAFVYSLIGDHSAQEMQKPLFGIHEAARYTTLTADEPMNVQLMSHKVTASAAANMMMEPIKLGPIHSYPDYLLVLSILGLISALLIMNWLSRTES